MNLLPTAPVLAAFLAASFVLAVTPGPGVFYVVTRSVAHGRLAGLASMAGVALGNLGNAIGASLGLAALFAVSSVAFTLVKYLGALYLVWLGVQALRAPPRPQADGHGVATAGVQRLRRIFGDGFLVALLNPKTTMFFAAFLPQFVQSSGEPVLQTLALGVIFVAIAAVTDTAYALMAGSARGWLARGSGVARLGRYLTAAAFIGLGVLTAVSGQRART
jgi:threonine/homoserine/homoserine lactone efflux protein